MLPDTNVNALNSLVRIWTRYKLARGKYGKMTDSMEGTGANCKCASRINDDGSGSTALLELIGAVKHYSVRNKVRFIWWGAEE